MCFDGFHSVCEDSLDTNRVQVGLENIGQFGDRQILCGLGDQSFHCELANNASAAFAAEIRRKKNIKSHNIRLLSTK